MSDNNQQNGERAPAKRTILSEFKTRLIGRPVDGAKKSPTFAFSINEKNEVSITVYSNIEGDRGNGLIKGKGDIGVLFMVTTLIRAAIATNGPFRRVIKHEDHVFMRGQRSERPMWIFDLIIQRDSGDSDVRLILKSYNRPDLEFYFRPTDYHRLYDGEGRELNSKEIADSYAIGYCEMLEDLASDLLNDYQIRLYAETTQKTVEGRQPSMVWGSIANNPRGTVFTNVEADQHINKGMIAAKIDPPTFYMFCELMGQAVTAPPGWRRGIKNYGHQKSQGGGRGEKVHETTLCVGKNEEGVIYIAVLDQDKSRPNLQFILDSHRRFAVLDGNEQPLARSRVTSLMAASYKKVFGRAVAKHLNAHYTPPDPSTWQNNQQGGNRQGGWNNNRGNGGGNGGGQRNGNWNNNNQGGGQQRSQGNWNNNRQQGGGNTQYQGGSQQGSGGGSQYNEPQQPAVPPRNDAPPAFDESIPF